HLALTALQISVAHELVAIQGRAFQQIACAEQGGTQVDGAQGNGADPRPHRLDVKHRIDLEVDRLGRRVAQGRRPEERQYDVRSGRHTPAAESLPEVFVVLLEPGLAGDVDQSGEAEGRIEG